jgi:hypothetical protein
MEMEGDWLPRAAFRLVISASLAILALVAVYLVVPLTPAVAWAATVFFCFVFGILSRNDRFPSKISRPRIRPDAGLILLACSFFADAALLALFALARTDEAIVSPWNGFSWEPFALFGISSILLFFGSRWREDRVSLAFSVWHAFVAVSVSAIVYGVGFGFDPFLHRAAEEELVANGFIEPRQLLYAGQYVLVSALHLVTGISVRTIDVWAMPVISSIALPIGTYLGLRYGWGLGDRDARSWWMVALIQPFMLATFTVPFTWTYVWFLVVLFLLPVVGRSRLAWAALLVGSVAMAAFHPLLAAPTLAFVVGYGVWARARTSAILEAFVLVGLLLAAAVSVPALFAVYQWSQGISVDIRSMVSEFGRFTSLFRSPYGHPYPFIPWFLEVIYGLRYWFPMVGMAIGIGVMAVWTKAIPAMRPYLAFTAGLILAILGVGTLFSFRGIISHEQSEYALRLLTAWYLIPLPAFAVLFAKLSGRWRAAGIVVATLVCAMNVHACFFSYPQFNLKYPFFSPSVSAADVEAVRAIDAHAEGRSYVVLSNQMTSAAAVQEFHFRDYVTVGGEKALWYAIPTGGPLYAYYARAIYEGPVRTLFDQLHADSSADIIYFVIQDYWPWYPGFVEELYRGADDLLTIRGGTVRVFIYQYE